MKPVYCDLDGVVIDCLRPALEFHGRYDLAADPNYPPSYDWEADTGLPHKEFWGAIEAAGPEWWSNLPYTPFGEALLKFLFATGNEINIATKVVGANGASGKYTWVKRELPPGTPVHITTDKCPMSTPGRLLIDDSPENIECWSARGGDTILCPAPYNDNRFLIGNELEYIITEMERLGYVPE